MFDGTPRRVVSMWFPRLASDRALRARPVEGPFALTLREANTERLACLDVRAEAEGLVRGMGLADARAYCPALQTAPARPAEEARFLAALRRWATRYCPWVGRDGPDGLVLDITGAAHLWGGEEAMLDDMAARATRAGLSLRLGLADTRGAAWALARHGQAPAAIAAPGAGLSAIGALPVAALRLDAAAVTGLLRLGLRSIADLAATPRGPLARRFGPVPLRRLDQALGILPEQIEPEPEPPRHAVRLSLPEPIGLTGDVMAATARLLERLCTTLGRREAGARMLVLTLRRVDQASQQVELRLAGAMRDPARILPLFERGIAGVEAGFGIDEMRLEATVVEPLPLRQTAAAVIVSAPVPLPAPLSAPLSAPGPARPGNPGDTDGLADLVTRIGTRIGLDNVRRFLPADSHIPERGFLVAPAAHSRPEGPWVSLRPRPLLLFPPEPVIPATRRGAGDARPPAQFRWRRMRLATARATGPERIAPEWWLSDDAWRSGLRDYWQVETRQGRRLWLFFTPQDPGWFAQGEFA